MIRFAHTEYLAALAVLPVLVAVYWVARRLRRKALARFGTPALVAQLTPGYGRWKAMVKFSLLAAAAGFILLGIANPQIGTKMEEVRREGVDIMIALDVSNSMKAQDIKPDRLSSAKQEIGRMIDKLQNDRIGLVVFAGDSYLQLPLTADYAAAKLLVSVVDVDFVPIQGTAIGSAIEKSMKAFVEGEKKHKVIVVITDGENHEDDAIAAAKEAAAEGVVVHTIGMGSPEGAPIPAAEGGGQIGFKKDFENNTVLTKLDEAGLEQIADAGGGRYVRATNQENELDVVLKDIQAMEKKEFGAKVFTEYEDRFQYFLAAGLLLLLVEFLVSERASRWFAKWKLFGEWA